MENVTYIIMTETVKNASQCKVSAYDYRAQTDWYKNITLQIYDVVVLKPESQIKELGVTQYEKLKLNQHVSQVPSR